MGIMGYEDLVVWQKAMDLTEEVYRLMKLLPKEELFSLQDQMKRAVVSIPSNIAEGYGRKNIKEFYRFLLIARGSAMELETQLKICIRIKYLTNEQTKKSFSLLTEIKKITSTLLTTNYCQCLK